MPLIVLTLLALFALAVLQYYWVGQVSEAARLSIQSSASTGATRVAEEFDRELARAYLDVYKRQTHGSHNWANIHERVWCGRFRLLE